MHSKNNRINKSRLKDVSSFFHCDNCHHYVVSSVEATKGKIQIKRCHCLHRISKKMIKENNGKTKNIIAILIAYNIDISNLKMCDK